MKVKYLGDSDPLALINGKVYEALSVEEGYYRVIDETEDDYLYDTDLFVIVESDALTALSLLNDEMLGFIKRETGYAKEDIAKMSDDEFSDLYDAIADIEVDGVLYELEENFDINSDEAKRGTYVTDFVTIVGDAVYSIVVIMSQSEGKRIRCIEKDGEEWTGIVDVYETDFDNEGDEQEGDSICVRRDDGLNVIVYSDEIEHIEILNTDNCHKCPVCGKLQFTQENSFEICPACNWKDDADQQEYPDEENRANRMSLNQAKEAWKNGQRVE